MHNFLLPHTPLHAPQLQRLHPLLSLSLPLRTPLPFPLFAIMSSDDEDVLSGDEFDDDDDYSRSDDDASSSGSGSDSDAPPPPPPPPPPDSDDIVAELEEIEASTADVGLRRSPKTKGQPRPKNEQFAMRIVGGQSLAAGVAHVLVGLPEDQWTQAATTEIAGKANPGMDQVVLFVLGGQNPATTEQNAAKLNQARPLLAPTLIRARANARAVARNVLNRKAKRIYDKHAEGGAAGAASAALGALPPTTHTLYNVGLRHTQGKDVRVIHRQSLAARVRALERLADDGSKVAELDAREQELLQREAVQDQLQAKLAAKKRALKAERENNATIIAAFRARQSVNDPESRAARKAKKAAAKSAKSGPKPAAKRPTSLPKPRAKRDSPSSPTAPQNSTNAAGARSNHRKRKVGGDASKAPSKAASKSARRS